MLLLLLLLLLFHLTLTTIEAGFHWASHSSRQGTGSVCVRELPHTAKIAQTKKRFSRSLCTVVWNKQE